MSGVRRREREGRRLLCWRAARGPRAACISQPSPRAVRPTAGDSYILTSIAAVVIGGVPLSGGRGTPVGVAMGALILTITGSLLYFADISSFYQSVIDGLILLAVVGSGATREWLRSIAAARCMTVSEESSPIERGPPDGTAATASAPRRQLCSLSSR